MKANGWAKVSVGLDKSATYRARTKLKPFFWFYFSITKPNQKGFGDLVNIHKTLRKHQNPY